MHPTRCVGVHLGKSLLSVQKWGAFAGDNRTDPAEILRNPRFSPPFKKREDFFNPCRVESTEEPPESPEQKAEAPCRPQSARPQCPAIVLRAPGGRERWRGDSGVAMATRKPRTLAETIAGNFSTKNLSVAPHGQPLSVSPQCFPDMTVGVMAE